MSVYSKLFERAADVVASTKKFPGQSIPGLWNTTTAEWPMLISVIISNAIGQIAREDELSFDTVFERFITVTSGEPFETLGDPAKMAEARLRAAARLNTIATESANDRLVRLSLDACKFLEIFAHSSAATETGAREAKAIVAQIRAACGDAAAGKETLS